MKNVEAEAAAAEAEAALPRHSNCFFRARRKVCYVRNAVKLGKMSLAAKYRMRQGQEGGLKEGPGPIKSPTSSRRGIVYGILII